MHVSPAQFASKFPKHTHTHTHTRKAHALAPSMCKMRFASPAATQPIALRPGHATTSCRLGNEFHLKIAD